jgi:hypothetical protein
MCGIISRSLVRSRQGAQNFPLQSDLRRVFCFKKFEKINFQKFAKNSGYKEKEFAK